MTAIAWTLVAVLTASQVSLFVLTGQILRRLGRLEGSIDALETHLTEAIRDLDTHLTAKLEEFEAHMTGALLDAGVRGHIEEQLVEHRQSAHGLN